MHGATLCFQNNRSSSLSDEDAEPKPEGEYKSKGQGEAVWEREGQLEDDHVQGASKLKNPISQVICIGNPRESEGRSPGDTKDDLKLRISAVIRDIFGDTDDEEQAEYAVQKQIGDEENRSLDDKEGYYENKLRPEDILADEEVLYESEEAYAEAEHEEKAAVPPLVLEVPTQHPLADLDKMQMIQLSDIVGIDPRPFDPSTYVEQDFYATDEFGSKKHIPSKNIIRWMTVKNPDGTTYVDYNARFVRWSDDSLQLLIGDESFDVSEQDAPDIQTHLFLKPEEGIFVCQGRIKKNMHFIPSSSTSDSHHALPGLVGARHKKVSKVKYCIADIDPEKEIEYKEKARKFAFQAAKSSHLPVSLSKSKKKESKYKHGRKNRAHSHEGSLRRQR